MAEGTQNTPERIPLVTDPTRSQSESVETIMNRLQNQDVIIPDYQRDAGQWDNVKESLLIESIINNLTIPAFFFSDTPDNTSEVVDGQQRLTTLQRFFRGDLQLAAADDVNYLIPASIQYAGKKFDDLSSDLKRIFRNYPLTIIYLPRSMNLSAKLEVFRRINEGGTPLTGQDIRLAYYSQSRGVNVIRLAGIYDSKSDSAVRVIGRMAQFELHNPWSRDQIACELWESWWAEKDKTKGQTPSHMFLWYLVTISRVNLDKILSNASYLKITFRGTIDEALDIYCAQQLHQEEDKASPRLLPSWDVIYADLFDSFSSWIKTILGNKLPSVSVEKYRQIALFIAAATELGIKPGDISDAQWGLVGNFIRNPRDTGKSLLGEGVYPEPKGRWTGQKGQRAQCDKAIEAVKVIVAS